MPRSVRVKRVRQARLRWSVLGLDARVDGFESGYVLACEARMRGDQPVKLLVFALDVCGRFRARVEISESM